MCYVMDLSLENGIILGRNGAVPGARNLAGVYWFLLSLSGEEAGRVMEGQESGAGEWRFPLKISC